MLEKISKEVGVWNAARDAVEERLAKLRLLFFYLLIQIIFRFLFLNISFLKNI